jgi:beta-xylosidase
MGTIRSATVDSGKQRPANRRRVLLAVAAIATLTTVCGALVLPTSDASAASASNRQQKDPVAAPPAKLFDPVATQAPPAPVHGTVDHFGDSLGNQAEPAAAPPAAATTSWSPVFNADFPDPTILVDGPSTYAYSTALGYMATPGISSNSVTHWSSYWDAMPHVPRWATWWSTWAPSVAVNAAGEFVEFYATLDKDLGTHCVGRAVSTSPTGPFIDTSTAPFLCQPSLGGSIDPSVFTDASGKHYLLWKSDGNSTGLPSHIWSAPIDPNLDALTGDPVAVLTNGQGWQDGVVENPDMVELNGTYHLFYSGGPFATSSYATGVATCASPLGPCTDGSDNPVLTSAPGMAGPGGADTFVTSSGHLMMAFAAWPGAIGNANGGHRAMYVATLSFNGDTPILAPAARTWLSAV